MSLFYSFKYLVYMYTSLPHAQPGESLEEQNRGAGAGIGLACVRARALASTRTRAHAHTRTDNTCAHMRASFRDTRAQTIRVARARIDTRTSIVTYARITARCMPACVHECVCMSVCVRRRVSACLRVCMDICEGN